MNIPLDLYVILDSEGKIRFTGKTPFRAAALQSDCVCFRYVLAPDENVRAAEPVAATWNQNTGTYRAYYPPPEVGPATRCGNCGHRNGDHYFANINDQTILHCPTAIFRPMWAKAGAGR